MLQKILYHTVTNFEFLAIIRPLFLNSNQLLKEDRQLFNAADQNIDGRLDDKEFLAFTHPEENPDMLPVILQQTLEEKDTNNDGVIDFQEYIGDSGEFLFRSVLETNKTLAHWSPCTSGYMASSTQKLQYKHRRNLAREQ